MSIEKSKSKMVYPMLVLLAIVGCDKTTSEKTSVEKKPDGTVVTDKEKTTTGTNGDSKTTTEHKVDK